MHRNLPPLNPANQRRLLLYLYWVHFQEKISELNGPIRSSAQGRIQLTIATAFASIGSLIAAQYSPIALIGIPLFIFYCLVLQLIRIRLTQPS